MLNTQPIYHLVPASYYLAQPQNQPYTPAAFATEGFIHCTSGEAMLIEVANTYFSTLAEPLLVLRIDPEQLTSPLKFEPPIPPGQTTVESSPSASSSILFPHIYGPVNREAIVDCFSLQRDAIGRWQI